MDTIAALQQSCPGAWISTKWVGITIKDQGEGGREGDRHRTREISRFSSQCYVKPCNGRPVSGHSFHSNPSLFSNEKNAIIPPTQTHSLPPCIYFFLHTCSLAEDSLKNPQDSFGPQESSTWRVGWSLYNQTSVYRDYLHLYLPSLTSNDNTWRNLCAYDYRSS